MYANHFPSIVASATMDGCVESGKDALSGGCKYNSTGLTGCGIGNVADCLIAIKKLCYDDKIVTTKELYDALCADWEGYESLYQAQKNPEEYRNLIVRIAGFSVYFVEMPKILQDDFISRTEHTTI